MLTGTVAAIRWAYYTAGAVQGFTVTRDKETRTWTVSGHLVIADAFKLSRTPLLFVVPHTRGEWVWPILGPAPRQAGPFTLTLGAPVKDARAHVLSDPPQGNVPH